MFVLKDNPVALPTLVDFAGKRFRSWKIQTAMRVLPHSHSMTTIASVEVNPLC